MFASVSLLAAIFPAATGAAEIPTTYPRDETLYTSGTMYGPPGDFNRIKDWDYTTGTFGLLFESLYLYNPLNDKFTPWLAQSGSWTGAKEYTLKLRAGLKWTDGEPLTADDVVYTANLGKLASVPYSTLWSFLSSVTKVDATTVVFKFSVANYQEWATWLYNTAIVPEHLWKGRSETDVMGNNYTAGKDVVGSGPYKLLTFDQQKVVWVRNDAWWGKTMLSLNVKPKYIVDLVNGSNNVSLGLMMQGQIDLSNNFLPGINSIVSGIGGYGIQTYYNSAPFMLSANTAWLTTNNARKPLNDPIFRRALAESINIDKIVSNVFGNIVKKASPTGLLPTWNKYVDTAAVKKYGFTYNVADAKKLLTDAGYKKGSDGYFRNKDGSKIDLEIIVPNGWTDWMASIQSIAASAKQAGIRIHTAFPSYNDRTDKIQRGNFDLAIMNDRQVSNSPWTYYSWVFRQPIQNVQNAGNFGRYKNSTAWNLVKQLDATPTTNLPAMKAVMSKLETTLMRDLPIIPLWYNGMWSQASN
ncbi:MAG: ABC transporter substrate-binding protein, partial [Chloroflexi bacterium]|nr:ABC transporter substrate-binding protein [Chloroflexota bacterium]